MIFRKDKNKYLIKKENPGESYFLLLQGKFWTFQQKCFRSSTFAQNSIDFPSCDYWPKGPCSMYLGLTRLFNQRAMFHVGNNHINWNVGICFNFHCDSAKNLKIVVSYSHQLPTKIFFFEYLYLGRSLSTHPRGTPLRKRR